MTNLLGVISHLVSIHHNCLDPSNQDPPRVMRRIYPCAQRMYKESSHGHHVPKAKAGMASKEAPAQPVVIPEMGGDPSRKIKEQYRLPVEPTDPTQRMLVYKRLYNHGIASLKLLVNIDKEHSVVGIAREFSIESLRLLDTAISNAEEAITQSRGKRDPDVTANSLLQKRKLEAEALEYRKGVYEYVLIPIRASGNSHTDDIISKVQLIRDTVFAIISMAVLATTLSIELSQPNQWRLGRIMAEMNSLDNEFNALVTEGEQVKGEPANEKSAMSVFDKKVRYRDVRPLGVTWSDPWKQLEELRQRGADLNAPAWKQHSLESFDPSSFEQFARNAKTARQFIVGVKNVLDTLYRRWAKESGEFWTNRSTRIQAVTAAVQNEMEKRRWVEIARQYNPKAGFPDGYYTRILGNTKDPEKRHAHHLRHRIAEVFALTIAMFRTGTNKSADSPASIETNIPRIVKRVFSQSYHVEKRKGTGGTFKEALEADGEFQYEIDIVNVQLRVSDRVVDLFEDALKFITHWNRYRIIVTSKTIGLTSTTASVAGIPIKTGTMERIGRIMSALNLYSNNEALVKVLKQCLANEALRLRLGPHMRKYQRWMLLDYYFSARKDTGDIEKTRLSKLNGPLREAFLEACEAWRKRAEEAPIPQNQKRKHAWPLSLAFGLMINSLRVRSNYATTKKGEKKNLEDAQPIADFTFYPEQNTSLWRLQEVLSWVVIELKSAAESLNKDSHVVVHDIAITVASGLYNSRVILKICEMAMDRIEWEGNDEWMQRVLVESNSLALRTQNVIGKFILAYGRLIAIPLVSILRGTLLNAFKGASNTDAEGTFESTLKTYRTLSMKFPKLFVASKALHSAEQRAPEGRIIDEEDADTLSNASSLFSAMGFVVLFAHHRGLTLDSVRQDINQLRKSSKRGRGSKTPGIEYDLVNALSRNLGIDKFFNADESSAAKIREPLQQTNAASRLFLASNVWEIGIETADMFAEVARRTNTHTLVDQLKAYRYRAMKWYLQCAMIDVDNYEMQGATIADLRRANNAKDIESAIELVTGKAKRDEITRKDLNAKIEKQKEVLSNTEKQLRIAELELTKARKRWVNKGKKDTNEEEELEAIIREKEKQVRFETVELKAFEADKAEHLDHASRVETHSDAVYTHESRGATLRGVNIVQFPSRRGKNTAKLFGFSVKASTISFTSLPNLARMVFSCRESPRNTYIQIGRVDTISRGFDVKSTLSSDLATNVYDDVHAENGMHGLPFLPVDSRAALQEPNLELRRARDLADFPIDLYETQKETATGVVIPTKDTIVACIEQPWTRSGFKRLRNKDAKDQSTTPHLDSWGVDLEKTPGGFAEILLAAETSGIAQQVRMYTQRTGTSAVSAMESNSYISAGDLFHDVVHTSTLFDFEEEESDMSSDILTEKFKVVDGKVKLSSLEGKDGTDLKKGLTDILQPAHSRYKQWDPYGVLPIKVIAAYRAFRPTPKRFAFVVAASTKTIVPATRNAKEAEKEAEKQRLEIAKEYAVKPWNSCMLSSEISEESLNVAMDLQEMKPLSQKSLKELSRRPFFDPYNVKLAMESKQTITNANRLWLGKQQKFDIRGGWDNVTNISRTYAASDKNNHVTTTVAGDIDDEAISEALSLAPQVLFATVKSSGESVMVDIGENGKPTSSGRFEHIGLHSHQRYFSGGAFTINSTDRSDVVYAPGEMYQVNLEYAPTESATDMAMFLDLHALARDALMTPAEANNTRIIAKMLKKTIDYYTDVMSSQVTNAEAEVLFGELQSWALFAMEDAEKFYDMQLDWGDDQTTVFFQRQLHAAAHTSNLISTLVGSHFPADPRVFQPQLQTLEKILIGWTSNLENIDSYVPEELLFEWKQTFVSVRTAAFMGHDWVLWCLDRATNYMGADANSANDKGADKMTIEGAKEEIEQLHSAIESKKFDRLTILGDSAHTPEWHPHRTGSAISDWMLANITVVFEEARDIFTKEALNVLKRIFVHVHVPVYHRATMVLQDTVNKIIMSMHVERIEDYEPRKREELEYAN